MEKIMYKKQCFVKFFLCLISSLVIILSSCATTLHVNITRPAKLDLNGAKSIAVLPFTPSSAYPFYKQYNGTAFVISNYFDYYGEVDIAERQAINFLQNKIEKGLYNSPYIDLIDANAVKQALKYGGVNPADVYLTGEMVTFNVNDIEKVVKKTVEQDPKDKNNKNKPKYYYEKQYTREVVAVFSYQVVDSATNKVISFDTVKFQDSSAIFDNPDDLPDPYGMISGELSDFVYSLLRDLQPYTVTKSITLLKDKTKNPDMKYADDLAYDGYYKESFNAFYKIYKETGLFEAGYNAAMILVATGNLRGAEDLMNNVYEYSKDERSAEALADIRNEIKLSRILKSQTN